MNAEQYIRQVEKALSASRSTRKAVARDLREAFASAAEHGENEQQVILRLGTPADFAASVRDSLGPRQSVRKQRWNWVCFTLSFTVGIGSLLAFGAARASQPPADAIGFAQGATDIAVQGAFDSSGFLLLFGAVALIIGAVGIGRFFLNARNQER